MAMGTTESKPAVIPVVVALLVGAGVSVFLGVYGNAHDPTGRAIFTLFFTSTINLKAWFTTAAVVLAGFQVLSGARIVGKISVPANVPGWLGDAHRLSGTLAFALTLPVAYHCLWSLGFESDADQTRRFVHSLLGCFFYGVFAVKIMAVRSRSLPEWVLPVAGGTVFTVLVGLWYTSALWFFRDAGFPSI